MNQRFKEMRPPALPTRAKAATLLFIMHGLLLALFHFSVNMHQSHDHTVKKCHRTMNFFCVKILPIFVLSTRIFISLYNLIFRSLGFYLISVYILARPLILRLQADLISACALPVLSTNLLFLSFVFSLWKSTTHLYINPSKLKKKYKMWFSDLQSMIRSERFLVIYLVC